MKIKICILTLMVLATITSFGLASAGEIYTPISETIDLKVDGSDATITINLTKTYSYITHLTMRFSYNDTIFIGDEFGEGTALTNGTDILYKGSSIHPTTIKRNEQFYKYFEELVRYTDDKDPKHTHLIGHMEFEHIFGINLRISTTTDLQFVVQDDLTSALYNLDAFKIVVQGYLTTAAPDNVAPKPNLLTDIQDFAVDFLKEPLWWVALLIPAAAIYMMIRK